MYPSVPGSCCDRPVWRNVTVLVLILVVLPGAAGLSQDWNTTADWRESPDFSGVTWDSIQDHDGTLQQGYRYGSMTAGLVGYWPMDDSSVPSSAPIHETFEDGSIVVEEHDNWTISNADGIVETTRSAITGDRSLNVTVAGGTGTAIYANRTGPIQETAARFTTRLTNQPVSGESINVYFGDAAQNAVCGVGWSGNDDMAEVNSGTVLVSNTLNEPYRIECDIDWIGGTVDTTVKDPGTGDVIARLNDTAFTGSSIHMLRTGGDSDGSVMSLVLDDVGWSRSTVDTALTNDGGVHGASYVSESRVGGSALDLDGADDYITIPDSASLDLQDAITIHAWVKPDTAPSNYYNIISKGDGGANGEAPWQLAIRQNRTLSVYRLKNDNYSAEHAIGKLPLDEWSSVTVTFDQDSGKVRAYVDGSLEQSWTKTNPIYTDDVPVTIGDQRWNGELTDNKFDGTIDDVRIYDRALSSKEVAELWKLERSSRVTDNDRLQSSLVGWWPLHETDSSTASDLSGHSNGGQLGNATDGGADTAEPIQGMAAKGGLTGYAFDGSDDYVQAPVLSELNTGKITVAGWAKSFGPQGGRQSLASISEGAGNDTSVLALTNGDGKAHFWINDGSTWVDVTTPTIFNEWVHIAGTYDGEDLKIYINGELRNTLHHPGSMESPGSDTGIGARNSDDSHWFNGLLGDLRIYDRPLTDSEIETLYHQGAGDFATPPGKDNEGVGYWDFDEGSGRIAEDSWNENDGTFGNGSAFTEPDWSKGKRGRALSFDGTDDHVTVDQIAVPAGNAERTLTAWAKMESGNTNTVDKNVVGYGRSNTAEHFGITYGLGSSYCWGLWGYGSTYDLWSQDNGCSSGQVRLNTWYHIAVAYDGTTEYIYINGKLANKQTVDLNTTATSLEIGSSPASDNDFPGQIDEVRLYNQSLEPRQVHDLYQYGTFGRDMRSRTQDRGMIGYWSLDEDAGQTVYDLSGHGNNGTTVNFDGDEQGSTGILGTTAYDFDNTDTFIDAGSVFGNQDVYAASFWFYPVDTGGQGDILGQENLMVFIWNRTSTAGTQEVNFATWGNNNNIASDISLNQWHHIYGEWNTETNRMIGWLDGEKTLDTSYTDGVDSTTSSLGIGSLVGFTGSSTVFDGKVDEVRIYNRSLSPLEIQSLYSTSRRGELLTKHDFGGPVQPDLSNLLYQQRKGSLSLTTIGSLEDDVREDRKVALDGQQRAYLNWSASHETVAVKTEFTTRQSNVLIDDFEDGDTEEYYGDTGNFSVVSGTVFEGDGALYTNSNNKVLDSRSGLPTYLEAGDTFAVRLYHGDSNTGTSVRFGVQDADNFYRFLVRGSQELELRKRVGGSSTILDNVPANWNAGEWLRLEGRWFTDGTISGTLYDANGNALATVSGTDSNFTEGGIGFDTAPQANNHERWIDNLKIRDGAADVTTAPRLSRYALNASTYEVEGGHNYRQGSLVRTDPDSSLGDLRLGTEDRSDSSLIGHWKLDEAVAGTGGAVEDHSGSGNTGNTSGGVTTGVSGIRGSQAFDFDGTDDHIQTNLSGSGELTYSVWARPASSQSTYAGIIQRDVDAYLYDAVLRTYQANWSFAVGTSGPSWQAIRTPYQAGTWQHVAATYGDGEARLYLNGELKETMAIDKLNSTAQKAFIGRYYDPGSLNRFYDGRLDDVRVYSSALSQEEIDDLYRPSPGYLTTDFYGTGDQQDVLDLSWNERLQTNTELQVRARNASGVQSVGSSTEWQEGTPFATELGQDQLSLGQPEGFETTSVGGSSDAFTNANGSWQVVTDQGDAAIWDTVGQQYSILKYERDMGGPRVVKADLRDADCSGNRPHPGIMVGYENDKNWDWFYLRSDTNQFVHGQYSGGSLSATTIGTPTINCEDYQEVKIVVNGDGTVDAYLDGERFANDRSIQYSSGDGIIFWDGGTTNYEGYADNFVQTRLGGSYTSQWFSGTKNWVQWEADSGRSVEPIAQWKMDEGSGQVVPDYVGGYNASLGDSTASETDDPVRTKDCRYNDCLTFDGSDDNLYTSTTFPRFTRGLTQMGWIKADSNKDNNMFDAYDSGGNWEWGLFISSTNNGELDCQIRNAADFALVGSNINDGRWHHVACTYSLITDTAKFYIDGEEVGTASASASSIAPAVETYFGQRDTDGSWNINGSLDDLRIYNRSLSEEEIRSIYHAPSSSWYSSSVQVRSSEYNPTKPALVGSWSFEGTGQNIRDTAEQNDGMLGPNMSDSSQDPVRVDGYSGQGLSFDGIDDYAEVSDSSAFQGDFTMTAWVKIPDGEGGAVTDNYDGAYPQAKLRVHNGEIGGGRTAGAVRLRLHDGSNNLEVDSSTVIDDGTWHFLTGVRRGDTGIVYIDGVKENSTEIQLAPDLTQENRRIGARVDGNTKEFFGGTIDEVKIYDRALSTNEIQALMNLSEFTSVIEQERGRMVDANNTNINGQRFDERYYQFKANLLSGSAQSSPRIEQVWLANASGWSSWFTDPTGNPLDLDSARYAQLQFNLSSTVATNTPTLDNATLDLADAFTPLSLPRQYTIDSWQEWLDGTFYNTEVDGSQGEEVRIGTRNGSDSSLVGYWRLNENVVGEGGIVTDSSGNDNDGVTKNGVTTNVDGIRNTTGFHFDGDDDYVRLLLPEIESEVTVSGWIRFESFDNSNGADEWQFLVDTYNGTQRSYRLGKRTSTNEFTFNIKLENGTSPWCDSGFVPNLEQWYHLAGTYDGEEQEIYVDGKQVASCSLPGDLEGSRLVGIGAEPQTGGLNWFHNGSIDDVKIYSRALPQSEIIDEYRPSPRYWTSGFIDSTNDTQTWDGFEWAEMLEGGTEIEGRAHTASSVNVTETQDDWDRGSSSIAAHDKLVGYWRFEEKVDGSGGTVRDWSGNGNSGTTRGGVQTAAGGFIPQSNAYSLDGVNDYIDIPNMTFGSTITASAWVNLDERPSPGNYGEVLIWSGGEYPITIWEDGSIDYYDGSRAESRNLTWQPGKWYHIAVAADNGAVTLYRNGANVTYDRTSSGGQIRATKIGANNNFYPMDIDEVRVYNKSLSQQEIRSEYSSMSYTSLWFTGSKNWVQWEARGGQAIRPTNHWAMDEGSGQQVGDGINDQNGARGTNTTSESGDPTWVDDCRYDGCLEFDGTDDYVNVSDYTAVDGSTEATWSFWLKLDGSSAEDNYVSKYSNPDSVFIIDDGVGANTVRSTIYNESDTGLAAETGSLTVGEWHHVVTTYDQDTLRVYVDGTEQASSTVTGFNRLAQQANQAMEIGSWKGQSINDRILDGRLDDLRVFNRSLSASEVSALYHATSAASQPAAMQVRTTSYDPDDPALIGSWSFEGTGQTVADSSGNSNTATLSENASQHKTDPRRADGYSGQGLDFDGKNDYVAANTLSAIDRSRNHTVALWLKLDELRSIQTIFNHYDSGDNELFGFSYETSPDSLGVGVYDYDSASYIDKVNASFESTNWTHIAYTWNKNTESLTLYMNGQDKTDPGGAVSITGSDELTIGRHPSSIKFVNGTIDEVKVYNRSLSQTEIKGLYNLSDFTSVTAKEWGARVSANTTALDGSSFQDSYYQFKASLLTGDTSSIPKMEKAWLADVSRWSSWNSSPDFTDLSLPSNRYAQLQFNLTTTSPTASPALRQASLRIGGQSGNLAPFTGPPAFTNYTGQHAFNASALVVDFSGDDDIQSCTVFATDGTTDISTAGTVNTAFGNQTQAACNYSRIDDSISGFAINDVIDVTIQFTDSANNQVNTSTASNPIPNRVPQVLDRENFPANPDQGDDVNIQVNTTDQEGDPIPWVNFTVEKDGTLLVDNQNGTRVVIGDQQLWNSSTFTLDEGEVVYNWNATISDGYDTRTTSGSISLIDVAPQATAPATLIPSPWNIPATLHRPGDRIRIVSNVTDENGRADLTNYTITVRDPSGTVVQTYRSPREVREIYQGYTIASNHILPEDAPTGQWNMTVTAEDSTGMVDTNSSTFNVTTVSDTTFEMEYSLGSGAERYIDRNPAQEGTYTDLDFPYLVSIKDNVMAGLINYGTFQRLVYRDTGGALVNISQPMADNTYILPMSRASLVDLEELEGTFTTGLFRDKSFLEQAQANIEGGVSDEKTVRVTLDFSDTNIVLNPQFNGELGAGVYELSLQNQGLENRSIVIGISPVGRDQ